MAAPCGFTDLVTALAPRCGGGAPTRPTRPPYLP